MATKILKKTAGKAKKPASNTAKPQSKVHTAPKKPEANQQQTYQQKILNESLNKGKEFFEKAAQYSNQKNFFQQGIDNNQVNKLYNDFLKDSINFNAEIYSASLKAFNNFYYGVDHVLQAYHEFFNTLVESNIKACKNITSCKNAQEALTVQSNLARDHFAKFMTEGSKISEMSVSIANEAIEPINECFTKVIGKIIK